MTYEEKIAAGLKLYLKEHYGKDVSDAWLNESEIERGYFTGCDTCGYGAEEDIISFTIGFRDDSHRRPQWVTLSGSTLDFFPTLLEYIDRAASELG